MPKRHILTHVSGIYWSPTHCTIAQGIYMVRSFRKGQRAWTRGRGPWTPHGGNLVQGKQERGGIGAHGFSSSFPPILRHCVTVKLFWEILNTQQMYLLSKLIHFFQSCHGPVASVVTHFTLLHILSCFAQVFLTLACVRIIHPCPLQKAPVLISRFRLGCLGNLG